MLHRAFPKSRTKFVVVVVVFGSVALPRTNLRMIKKIAFCLSLNFFFSSFLMPKDSTQKIA